MLSSLQGLHGCTLPPLRQLTMLGQRRQAAPCPPWSVLGVPTSVDFNALRCKRKLKAALLLEPSMT